MNSSVAKNAANHRIRGGEYTQHPKAQGLWATYPNVRKSKSEVGHEH